MRKLISILLAAMLLAAALPLGAENTALAATDYSTVRVRLSNSGSTTITASVRGNYFIQETGATFSGGTLTIQYSSGNVVLSHSNAGQLYSGRSVNVMRESYAPSSGYISMSVSGTTRSYLGNFQFKTSGSSLLVVNTVPLQHYLYGVVAFEMSNNFPLEALKAQAVAAKCYVLSGMSPSSDYDIRDTAEDQVYKGYSSSYTQVIRAVDETYDVWLYLGNSILCSYFAASNGGQTILPSDTWTDVKRSVWDGAYARTEDPYDIANPLTVQETTFYPTNGDSGNISPALSNYLRNRSTDILRTKYGDRNLVVSFINSVDSMMMRSNTTADITLTVTVQHSNGATATETYPYTEDFAYLTVNGVFTKAQSLRLYTLTPQNGGWLLRRGRYGHGVGLSQRGAEQMANQGINYQNILKFYYPGAAIRSMGIALPSDPVNSSGSVSSGPVGDPIATAVTTGNVAFRQGPSTKTTKMDTVPRGTSLYVYGEQDGFSQVTYNNTVGYVSNTYLKVTPLSSGNSTPSSGSTTVILYGEVKSSTLNLRDQASTSGRKITTLKKGVKLDIYGYANNSTWYYCSANGQVGYVSAEYVTITGTPSPAATDPGTSTPAGPVVSGSTGTINQSNIYMRSEATNSSGRRVIGLSQGVTVTVTGESGDFYAATITYQGATYTGYIEKQFVNVASSPGAVINNSGGSSGGSTSGTQTGETTGNVNFRKGPGTKYSKIKQLSKGTALTILSYSGGWYEVTVSGTTGYVSGDYVRVTSGGSSQGSGNTSSAGSTVSSGVIITETTRLRSTPSTSSNSNILGEYPVGTELQVYHTEGEFYKVKIGNTEGYMHMTFVQITGTTSLGSSGVTTATVNFRSGPNTKGTSVYKVLSKGTSVTVLGSESDFYYVEYGSQKGYLSKKYVSVVGGASTGSGAAASSSGSSGTTTGNVRLRSEPDTSTSRNILTTLQKGTKITVHSTSNGWHYVTVDGRQGYVSAQYVRV